MHTLLTLTYFSRFVTIHPQWGYANTKNEKNTFIRDGTFPIAFPTKVFACYGTIKGLENDNNQYTLIWVDGKTTNSTIRFSVVVEGNLGSPAYFAIGK